MEGGVMMGDSFHMIKIAEELREECISRKTCKGCPFRVVELPAVTMHCMFEERRHPYNWHIPGDYANQINKIRKDL